ncbi:MAG: aminopeptidase P family N-terminal domain-containing protein, partial [Actinomycetota bacterium]|nr:aminopeptidase P family N-terminal domain-containing protein [Actinomycetota bacterium]
MDHHLRRRAVAARLEELSVDALLITRLLHTRYLSGFTGSNGQVLIRPGEALFLTDGRYTEQSRREVPDLERHTCVNP